MKTIKPGTLVYWRNEAAVVLELKGLSELILRNVDSGQTDIAPISEISISPVSSDSGARGISHLTVEEKEWDKALQRFELIQPLLELPGRQKEDVQKIADKAGKSLVTIYRWLKKFEETGLVSSLLRTPRHDKGSRKLSDEVEDIISIQLKDFYLKKERPSAIKVYRQVALECHSADLPVPHKNTIYTRVKALNAREKLQRRFSSKAAREKYEPIRGRFPGADYPNAVVQIDHTKVDLIVVDKEHRLPIGRPYLTIAIDVATKMISGFTLTLDPPGALSAGLCIGHAAARKEHWLVQNGIDAEWPIYGKMEKIHVDNAKEFRGTMLTRACQQHGIILENRPKGMPNYGPHVERAFRTYMQECHSIPGTTFSSVAQRVEYDSEGHACMTLDELNIWFSIFILYCYHHKSHAGNQGTPPIKMFFKYVHGNNEMPGCGLPEPIEDEFRFQLDFTPYVERSIQRDGVRIDNIQYYSPVLRKWVGAKNAEGKSTRQFVFARDPRNISQVYFHDPDTSEYIPVPYLNNTRPEMSLWELREVTRSLKAEAHSLVNEEMIFEGLRKMREIEETAIEKTRLSKRQRASEKRKRTMAERRTHWKSTKPHPPSHAVAETDGFNDDEEILPFSDIKVL